MKLSLDGYINYEIQIVNRTKPHPETGVKHFHLNIGFDDYQTIKKVVDAVFPSIRKIIEQGRPCAWKIRTKYIGEVYQITNGAEKLSQFKLLERVCEVDKNNNVWMEVILHFNK